MSPDSASRPFFSYDLRTGGFDCLQRLWRHPLQGPVAAAIQRSQSEDGVVEIVGTSFGLFASPNSVQDGNAPFCLLANSPMGEGRMTADTILYGGVVACQLATAPIAWRHAIRFYLEQVAIAPPLLSFNAPGPMPVTMPWLCGFMMVEGDKLTKDERATLSALVHLTGIILLKMCEQACEEAEKNGRAPELNLERYPELRDWSD